MKPTLAFTDALSPLAARHGVDLTPLAKDEIDFNQKLSSLQAWLSARKEQSNAPDA